MKIVDLFSGILDTNFDVNENMNNHYTYSATTNENTNKAPKNRPHPTGHSHWPLAPPSTTVSARNSLKSTREFKIAKGTALWLSQEPQLMAPRVLPQRYLVFVGFFVAFCSCLVAGLLPLHLPLTLLSQA